jgi:hypothetical protein
MTAIVQDIVIERNATWHAQLVITENGLSPDLPDDAVLTVDYLLPSGAIHLTSEEGLSPGPHGIVFDLDTATAQIDLTDTETGALPVSDGVWGMYLHLPSNTPPTVLKLFTGNVSVQ